MLLVVGAHLHAAEVDLKTLIANPKQFDGKMVTTTGLVADSGNGVYLFPDFLSAAKGGRDARQAAYIPDTRGLFTKDDHRCWFAIQGVVNSRGHGPWGDNPCEIEVTSIRKLRPEKRPLWPDDIGVFLNATSEGVMVDSELPDGGSAIVEIAPSQTQPVQIIPGGEVTISRSAGLSSSKAKMYTTRLHYPQRKRSEPSERRFRFVVRDHGIDMAGADKKR